MLSSVKLKACLLARFLLQVSLGLFSKNQLDIDLNMKDSTPKQRLKLNCSGQLTTDADSGVFFYVLVTIEPVN